MHDARVDFLPNLKIDTRLNVWTLAAVLTALYTLSGLVRGWWHASLGKRRRLIRAYRKLATYVRHDYVEGLFGEPAWDSGNACTPAEPTHTPCRPSPSTSADNSSYL
jgi:hypothetical protein